jgi:hypothetical protein
LLSAKSNETIAIQLKITPMTERPAASTASPSRYWKDRLRLPQLGQTVPQDAEWCEVYDKGKWHRLRFHDYGEIFERPGLYEYLFYDLLQCQSPQRVVGLLQEVGVDILEEARTAAQRDFPQVYSDYYVADITDPPAAVDGRLRALRPNALACVAALGFGDIPPKAYHTAVGYVAVGGLLAFNIKAEFLDVRYTHGFSELMRRMVNAGVVRIEATRRYRHRLSASGEPIFYTAMIVTKLAEIPATMLVEGKNDRPAPR